jgi:hypothetical protein
VGGGRDLRSPVGLPRDDEEEHLGRRVGNGTVGGEGDGLVLGVGRGGKPERPPFQGGLHIGACGRVVGERRRGGLEGAGDGDGGGGAECLEVAGGGRVLRGDEIEGSQERRVEPAGAGPAPVGRGIHPRVDEGEGDAARRGVGDEAGPEVLFGPDRQVGPPVVEEAAARTRQVQGKELVDRARRQVAGGCEGGRSCGGGDEEGQVRGAVGHLGDEAAERQHLAQTHGMEPGETAGRARCGRFAQLLAPAGGVLLSAREAVAEDRRGERGEDVARGGPERRARGRPRAQARSRNAFWSGASQKASSFSTSTKRSAARPSPKAVWRG